MNSLRLVIKYQFVGVVVAVGDGVTSNK